MTLQTIPVPAGLQTRYFILERGALSSLPELLNTAFPGKQPWLIADKNTWAVAGEETAKILSFFETAEKDAENSENGVKKKPRAGKKFFDIEKTGKKLYVRNRRFGDSFLPNGLDGTKKIKDFFSIFQVKKRKGILRD